jgi:hypothetical protein
VLTRLLLSWSVPQCPLQQVTHAQIHHLQQQLNQAVAVKQQDVNEVHQVGDMPLVRQRLCACALSVVVVSKAEQQQAVGYPA